MAIKLLAIIALILVLTKESTPLTCDLSFNGTCHIFVRTVYSWTQAEANCVQWGGNLVSIHSDEEYQQVGMLSQGHTIWIGMTDSATEDVWKWTDGSDSSYHRFSSYPPYDYYNNQDCAYMYFNYYYYYYYYNYYYNYYRYYAYWYTHYCSHRHWYSVCGQTVPMPSAPRGLVLESSTSTSLSIKWESPITHYSSLTQYTVSVKGQQLDTEVKNSTIVTESLSDQTYTLYGLEEANLYTISVSAHTHGGEGAAITIMNIQTREDAPSGSPTIEGAFSPKPTEIELTWSSPPLSERNGVLTNYSISYSGRLLDTATRVIVRHALLPRMLTLTGLEEYTQYTIEISASTMVGTGPVSTSFVTTAAAAPSAAVTNHTVTTLSSTQLFVSWSPPPLADRNGVLSYKLSHKRSGLTSYTTVGVTAVLSFTLSGLEEAFEYSVMVTAVSVGMDGPASIVTATTLMDVPDYSAQDFALSSSTSSSITVTWQAPSAEAQNGQLTSYVLVYAGTELDQQERMVTLSTSASGFTTSYTAQNLEAYSYYTFSIIAYTSVGSGPAMTITGLQTLEDVPSGTPNDISLVAFSANSIRISFSPVDLMDRNGRISHYTVYYTGSRLQPEQKQLTAAHSESEHLIEGLEEASEYSVSISASTLEGEGPISTEMKVTTLTSIPSAAVSNLNATAVGTGFILVEWDELPYPDRNGELIGYEVMYWRNTEDSRMHSIVAPSLAEVGRVSINLMGLLPYTSYMILVSAVNADGTGESNSIPSLYTNEDFPVIEVSYMSGSSPDPHTATLTWTKPNCINETQVLNTKYNLTYVYTDHMMVEHTQAMVSSDNFQSVDNLLPYTEYTFTVSPFTGAGDGSLGPPAVVRTQAKIPSMPPSSVTLQAINCSTILVTCMPPAAEHQNGPLLSYSILYNGNAFDTVMREIAFELSEVSYPDSTTRSFYLNELMEYERYTVMVKVSTGAGYSEYTAASHVRTTEAAPTDSPQDVLAMPSNSTCVRVEWNAPPVTSQRGAIASYTIMYQGVQRDTNEQTVTIQVSPVFPDMRHQSHLLCGLMEDTIYHVRLQCSNTAGSSSYSLAASVRSQEAAPSAAPSDLTHVSHTPYATVLTWAAPGIHEQNGAIRYYNLYLTVQGANTNQMIMAPSLSYTLSPLNAYTTYTVTVAAVTAEGVGPSATLTFTTPQDVPSHGVSSLKLTDSSSTSLSLSWLAPLPSQRRGVLVEYMLRWYGFSIDTSLHTATVALGDLDSVREHTIEGLEEATNYTVEVTAVGEEGNGPSVRLTHICTSPAAPSSSVQSLELVSVTSRYCIISWMAPPLSEQNGPLEDYRIYINSSMHSKEYDSMVTSYRIEDLNEHTLYSVYVASTNSEGEGPLAMISFTTLQNVPSGAPLNFRVSDIGTTSLTAHWSPPALADRNGVLKEYLLTYMGEREDTSMRSVRVAVVSGQEEADQTYRLEGLEEYTNYSLEVSVINDRGESPVARLQSVHTLPDVPSVPVSDLMVESVSARSALISWSSPAADSLNGAGAHFRVHMSAGSLNRNRRDSEETEMYTEAQHAMLTNLSPNSLYTVTVEPANSEGMGPSSQLDVSTMEDVPSAAVQSVMVSDITSSGLTVSWQPPPISHQNGAISLYTVLVSAVNSSFARSVTSQETTVEITGLHPNYAYTVSVTAEGSSGSGIASDPVLFTTLQAVPSATVSNFGILTINRTTVLLTWSPLARELQNGDITQYSLSYLSHSLKETFSLSTDQFFYYINSLNATDGYTFTLSADNSVGAGPIVVGTVTQDPETPVSFQYTEKEMSFTVSGLLLLGILLLVILVIVICLVVCLKSRRRVKRAHTKEDRIGLKDIEVSPGITEEPIYSGMEPVKATPPTYANFTKVGEQEKRCSVFKSELGELPIIPVKSEDTYASPHGNVTYVNRSCEVEIEPCTDAEKKDSSDA